jgi:N-acetyl-anhydromuramyl-L-alanine amidase AmpD
MEQLDLFTAPESPDTTELEQVIQELQELGYRVGVSSSNHDKQKRVIHWSKTNHFASTSYNVNCAKSIKQAVERLSETKFNNQKI